MKRPNQWLICIAVLLAAWSAYGRTRQSSQPARPQDTAATLLQQDAAAGLELWQTLLGKLWIPRPGIYVIKHLQWEQQVQQVYHDAGVHVQKGDVVMDCGAHIGGFTRVALNAGAARVIAIEPEQANVRAFRRNFAAELKTGRVQLIEKGVWDADGEIALHVSAVGDSHSAVVPQAGGKDARMQVLKLDTLVSVLKLPRVDFVKMDIEGGEQKALQGAAGILRRWKPRLAISSYHMKGDPAAITSFIWATRPDYLVSSKDLIRDPARGTVPKVLFFR